MQLGSHLAKRMARARAQFVEVRGAAAVEQRAKDIAALPSKDWRGVHVVALRCEGPFGRGPHVQFVPEYLLWSLIDLRHWICPFHQ